MKMNIRYKLTKQDLTTYANTKWVLNEWKETSGTGKLCTEGWLHCYTSPLLAILLNPIHANITNPKLFKCEVEGKCLEDNGLKEGWTRMRIIEEIEIPQLSLVQKLSFAILCVLEVYKDEKWIEWANNWLNGKDRSKEFANAANAAAVNAAAANAAADAADAADAANAYANADYYAAAAATYATYAANYAAAAADSAAYAASDAAYYAAAAATYATYAANIDLIKLAKKAMKIK